MITQDMIASLEAIYIEWFNNYLTIDKFAEHLDIEPSQAKVLLEIGAKINRSKTS